MKLVTFIKGKCTQVGVLVGQRIIDLSKVNADFPTEMTALISDHDFQKKVSHAIESAPPEAFFEASTMQLAPVIPKPGKIICIGRNYAAHAAEGGAETPTYPEIFFRGPESLIAHNSPIIRPTCSDKLDYEGEIAFVIGKRARHCSMEDGLDYIAGYTVFNDATIRDYQRKSSQWTIGKNFDGTGAFGPMLVTPDEVPLGLTGTQITTRLNGNIMQNANTDDLVFPVRRLMAILSECMTLMPGDVVVTGTPAGVGYARNPPVYMVPGDVVEVEVSGLGVLRNDVVDE